MNIKKIIFTNKKGDASIAVLSLLMAVIITMFGVTAWYYKFLSVKLEGVQDDLTYSNLAVYKNLDMTAIAGDDKNISINDTSGAVSTFENYLEKNMNLDSNMNGLNGSIAAGKVTLDELTIYNVYGNSVNILTYDKNTGTFTSSEVNDITKTPVKTTNGKVITNTCVHSTIEFKINMPFGIQKTSKVFTDTDITRDMSAEN